MDSLQLSQRIDKHTPDFLLNHYSSNYSGQNLGFILDFFLFLTPQTHSINKYSGICFWNTARIWTHRISMDTPLVQATLFSPWTTAITSHWFPALPLLPLPSLVSIKQPGWTSKNDSLITSVLSQSPSDFSSQNKSRVLSRYRGPLWYNPNYLPAFISSHILS